MYSTLECDVHSKHEWRRNASTNVTKSMHYQIQSKTPKYYDHACLQSTAQCFDTHQQIKGEERSGRGKTRQIFYQLNLPVDLTEDATDLIHKEFEDETLQ